MSIKNECLKAIKYTIVVFVSIVTALPLVLVLMASLTPESDIMKSGFLFIPQRLTLEAYRYIMMDAAKILNAYKISVFITLAGTATGLIIMALYAYPISLKGLKGRKMLSFIVVFTMLFNSGLVPWFIICTKYLGLRDTVWALILPYLAQPFNIMLLRGFFQTIPQSFRESALIDGANELRIFVRIILPLSLPAIAAIGLFISILYWNDWFLSLMLVDDTSLYPVQFLLRRIISSIQFLQSSQDSSMDLNVTLPSESVKMATCIITIGPVLLFYPFVQKYFITGITLGGVKG